MVYLFFISFFIVFLSIPIVIKFAHNSNVLDVSNKRKIHTVPTPRLGGIVFSLVSIFLCFAYFFSFELIFFKLYIFLIILFVIFILGFLDDVFHLKYIYKIYSSNFLCYYFFYICI